MNKLVIVGASGHGKVIADMGVLNGYKEIVFLDDNCSLIECAGFPVVGPVSKGDGLENADFVIAIGNANIRKCFYEHFNSLNKNLITLVHPNAVISRRVNIGKGTVVMAGAIINSDTDIGDGCIINTAATVGHDCKIGDYVHVSAGAHVAGTVEIGKMSWIGVGSSVINNVTICEDCLVGAGAAVTNNLRISGTYVGVPAKRLKSYRK